MLDVLFSYTSLRQFVWTIWPVKKKISVALLSEASNDLKHLPWLFFLIKEFLPVSSRDINKDTEHNLATLFFMVYIKKRWDSN